MPSTFSPTVLGMDQHFVWGSCSQTGVPTCRSPEYQFELLLSLAMGAVLLALLMWGALCLWLLLLSFATEAVLLAWLVREVRFCLSLYSFVAEAVLLALLAWEVFLWLLLGLVWAAGWSPKSRRAM
jgi:hypothetical protein